MTAAVHDDGLVTIGLTCYNAADTIERALTSAFVQDWPNVEILIVDDASTDNSAEVVARVIDGRPNARLIRHETNAGPAAARNTLLSAAKGSFLVFFDDDDEALPERVRQQIDYLRDYEQRTGASLVACYASGKRRYSSGYEMQLAAIGSRGDVAPHGRGVADYLLLYRKETGWFFGTGTPSCSLLARRSTFEAVGGFDAGLRRVEDVDFAVRLALKGGHFIGTAEPLFVQHSTSAQDKSPERNLESELMLVGKHRPYLESIGRYHYAANWPKLRYWHFKRRYGRFIVQFLNVLLRHPLTASRHLLSTGPRRLLHEYRIKRGG
ncbi:Glycosyl transferase, family 2 [Candidatus Filomicrobium marinum]|uniref:Glycosyl transferase, family 2 n=2 Tax=Filomicrobium TaxID=119044 RepID=A0A0D6JIB1_9HYPH|nr:MULTISPECIES: glycosyltransferase [Filomicrobium]MCV0371478.1 glycosyltransferase [Filomicrobium sp.]CFX36694.1 Glycosyl transferase, family 2 [Candidatus Filomicrobium marinum]CPR21708.1 Glycosyl transferase, family 2 [Candidatus Filomicrobium marinum]SDP63143.1 Glycosyl transferase family 2 [Filomicrobium insigne]